MAQKIQLRNDISANWASVNPVLMLGEVGLETDTGKYKTGNGVGTWSTLSYGGGGTALDTTYNNTTSGLTATEVQSAIDELDTQVDTNKTDILTLQTQNGSEVLTTTAQTLSGAINENREQINTLDAEFVAHKAESLSELLYVTRDGALVGTQVISTIGKPKKIDIKAYIPGTKIASFGSSMDMGLQQAVYIQGDTGNVYKGDALIVVAASEIANMVGLIQNITTNSFEILWSKTGTGAGGTIGMEIDVLYHGGN